MALNPPNYMNLHGKEALSIAFYKLLETKIAASDISNAFAQQPATKNCQWFKCITPYFTTIHETVYGIASDDDA